MWHMQVPTTFQWMVAFHGPKQYSIQSVWELDLAGCRFPGQRWKFAILGQIFTRRRMGKKLIEPRRGVGEVGRLVKNRVGISAKSQEKMERHGCSITAKRQFSTG